MIGIQGLLSSAPDIIFPNVGIEFQNVSEVAFRIFGLEIYWYALFITLGFIGGWGMACVVAKKNQQPTEIYSDYLLYGLISAIIGARLYYVLFSLEDYKDNWLSVFNLREGGLAIYGGVIGAAIAMIVYTKIKKRAFFVMADVGSVGIFVGQIFGRIGNFMNKEAFGTSTDGLLAMAIKRTEVKYIPPMLRDQMVILHEVEYLQVHPMFLYEMVWNLLALIFTLWYFKHRRFHGEVFALYFLLYSLGRFWMEMLRTDQLIIGQTGIAASVVMAGILVVVATAFIVVMRLRAKRLGLPMPHAEMLEKGDLTDLSKKKA